MIKSMTGYGRAEDLIDGMQIAVECKSVNHRYLEFSAKAPRNYGFLEEKLKRLVMQSLSRGKVECFVQLDLLEDTGVTVEVNRPLAEGYVAALRELVERYGVRDDISACALGRFSDVFSIHKAETDEAKIWSAVQAVAQRAVEACVQMREREGERLQADILSRADRILEDVAFIEARSPETVRLYREKLFARMQEVLADAKVDEQRILTEAAIYADKVAVDEETVRLRSHIGQLHAFFAAEEAIGRKMDFLVQEMNREANTIGSKAQDVEIARKVLDIKAEIEKIREQVQNIE
ncbi:MAG TPA: YicC family protein [Candidatus Fimivicinus intestinavium]|nr:YicC family protein [Candidatus Fimivicinus intestinavium]